MDWIKLILESIVEVLHYVAWPAIILVVVLLFRKHIEELLKSRMKVRHKDIEFEFNIPSELQRKMVKKVKLSDVNKDTLTWEHYLDALEYWAFNLGMKLHFVITQQPLSASAKTVQYEIEQLKTISDKIAKERPNSNLLDFANIVLNYVDSVKAIV